MPNTDYYSTLGVPRGATEADIKKAYKKKAMQYHPDRNKGDKQAEKKFKEINEAYQTLGDTKKRQNYDQFGSAEGSPFGGMGGGNPFSGRQQQSNTSSGFSGFEDIFSQFGGRQGSNQGFEFDLGDILGGMGGAKQRGKNPFQEDQPIQKNEEKGSLDVTETVEIPFLDFLYDTSIDIRTIYGKHLTLKVKAGTKPGTRFKISGKGRSSEGKMGDMYVIVDARMPDEIPKSLKPMIDALRNQL